MSGPGSSGTQKAAQLRAFAKPNHNRVARSVCDALTLDDNRVWLSLSAILLTRLVPQERKNLACAVLMSMEPTDIEIVVKAVLPKGAGQPIAPLFSHLDEASFWADMAKPIELEAYALACFVRMPPERQAAFIEYLQGRLVA